ncbi:MAG: Na-translocating system protein MpsC family protein [Anaerovorax sp.]
MNKEKIDCLKQVKVLYVEDEDETRAELHEFLKRRVGKIYPGQDGQEGLELYKEHEPDIIIADLFMPKMGGMEMVREIKAVGKNPGVIITSAISDVNVILRAVDIGIDKYIVKPIDIDQLLEALVPLAEKAIEGRKESTVMSSDYKKKLEDEIKRVFAAFLKSATGKGPKDVSVFLSERTVEITAYDVLTPFEKSILENSQNVVSIKQNRELFYDAKAEKICRLVEEILGRKTTLEKVFTDVEKGTNRIVVSVL